MKNELLYLSNISECIGNIETYTKEGKTAFFQNRMMQDAVIRNLEIIGEATKRLSPEIRNQYPDIPWRQIAGLRDVLIHDYLRVDLEEVWRIVEINLPDLKTRINQIIIDIT
ncbi:conserved hypothetical protein [Coleofasciculus chthonoplastes PCC 7420]|uniref:DUF86 domain-containing protein n=1 Tax=Coleofasciculus chthonoplastes PCC 7420 TaxID=118168 RepID=B4VK61_9CYAN|nr:DUF86 domain-containing protein [Coleofasciculus chthonoplastes]EDX77630.1 conserved hypothetical protein [Coleofasciculus chthonoplastes PCC 7420]